MYRGSTFLLKKDYKIHLPIVHVLSDPKYEKLRALDFKTKAEDKIKIGLIMDLGQEIRRIYKKNFKPTDTLITKILLGTLGCVPAYDQNVVAGLKKTGIKPASFGVNSLEGLILFYRKNEAEFNGLKSEMKTQEGKIKYPVMKLLDMYLWTIGEAEIRAKIGGAM